MASFRPSFTTTTGWLILLRGEMKRCRGMPARTRPLAEGVTFVVVCAVFLVSCLGNSVLVVVFVHSEVVGRQLESHKTSPTSRLAPPLPPSLPPSLLFLSVGQAEGWIERPRHIPRGERALLLGGFRCPARPTTGRRRSRGCLRARWICLISSL